MAMIGVMLLSLLLAILYTDTILPVVQAWNRWRYAEFYSHGYLALLMSAYMIFQERSRLALHQPCPSMVGITLLVPAVFAWLLAELADIQLVEIIAVLMMLFAVLWTVLGWAVVRIILPAVALLIFALPVWGPLPPLLQVLTADAAYAMARIAGLPALLQGQVIVL